MGLWNQLPLLACKIAKNHANSVYGEPQYVTIFHQFSNVLIIMAGKEFQHAPLILVA